MLLSIALVLLLIGLVFIFSIDFFNNKVNKVLENKVISKPVIKAKTNTKTISKSKVIDNKAPITPVSTKVISKVNTKTSLPSPISKDNVIMLKPKPIKLGPLARYKAQLAEKKVKELTKN